MKNKRIHIVFIGMVGLLIIPLLGRKNIADDIRDGDWEEALTAYYELEQKQKKRPIYAGVLKRARLGLQGKGNLKRYKRTTDTFDPVVVEQEIVDAGMDVPEFVEKYSDINQLKQSVAAATAAGPAAMQDKLDTLRTVQGILGSLDKAYEDEVSRQVFQPLSRAVTGKGGARGPKGGIKRTTTQNASIGIFKKGSWQDVLRKYDELSQDRANDQFIGVEVIPGVRADASAVWKRDFNAAKGIQYFDIDNVVQALRDFDNRTGITIPDFINQAANYPNADAKVALLLASSEIQQMMDLVPYLQNVQNIIAFMNTAEALKFDALKVSLQNKIRTIQDALITGTWAQALGMYQALTTSGITRQFMEDVIKAGLNNRSTEAQFNRAVHPIDIEALDRALTAHHLTLDDLLQKYKDRATLLKSFTSDLKAVLVNPTDAALQETVDGLKAVKACIDLLDATYAQEIDTVIAQAKSMVGDIIKAKNHIKTGTWKEALTAYEELKAINQYKEMIQNVVNPGFNGAANEFTRTHPFNVVAVIAEIATLNNAGNLDVTGFITSVDNFTDTATKVQTAIATNTLAKIQKWHDMLAKLVAILTTMHDATEAARFEGLVNQLQAKIHTLAAAWTLSAQAKTDLTTGTWQKALVAYASIPQDPSQDPLRGEVEQGLLGNGTTYKRTQHPFDVKAVQTLITTSFTDIPSFVATYGDFAKYQATLIALSKSNSLTDVTQQRETLEKVIAIIAIIDPANKLTLQALELTLNNRIGVLKNCEAQKAVLTTGSWQDALQAYYTLSQTPENQSFLNAVIAPGLEGQGTDNTWKRTAPFTEAMLIILSRLSVISQAKTIPDFVAHYSDMVKYNALLANATEAVFAAGNTDALKKAAQELKDVITVITHLGDAAYAQTLTLLQPEIQKAIGIIDQSKKDVTTGTWQKVLTGYNNLVDLSRASDMPEGIRSATGRMLTTVVVPGLNGAANSYKRQYTVDILQVASAITPMGITIDKFVQRYDDPAQYKTYVTRLIAQDEASGDSQPSQDELLQLQTAGGIIDSMHQDYSKGFADAQKLLQDFIDNAAKRIAATRMKQAVQDGRQWQDILLAYAQVEATGDQALIAAVQEGFKGDNDRSDYHMAHSIAIISIKAILKNMNMDIPTFIREYATNTGGLQDRFDTLVTSIGLQKALEELARAIKIINFVKDSTLKTQLQKIYDEEKKKLTPTASTPPGSASASSSGPVVVPPVVVVPPAPAVIPPITFTADASVTLPTKLAETFKTGAWNDVLREYYDIENAFLLGKYKTYKPHLAEIRAGVAGQGGQYKRTVDPKFDIEAVKTQIAGITKGENINTFLRDYGTYVACDAIVETLIDDNARESAQVQKNRLNPKLEELKKAIAIITQLDTSLATSLETIATKLDAKIKQLK